MRLFEPEDFSADKLQKLLDVGRRCRAHLILWVIRADHQGQGGYLAAHELQQSLNFGRRRLVGCGYGLLGFGQVCRGFLQVAETRGYLGLLGFGQAGDRVLEAAKAGGNLRWHGVGWRGGENHSRL